MARTLLAKTAMVGPYPTLPVSALALDTNFQAADVANKNYFVPSGDDILLVWNTHATTPYTFTLTSVADERGRTGDIGPYTVAPGVISMFKIKKTGWLQLDGNIYLEANNASIKFAIVSL